MSDKISAKDLFGDDLISYLETLRKGLESIEKAGVDAASEIKKAASLTNVNGIKDIEKIIDLSQKLSIASKQIDEAKKANIEVQKVANQARQEEIKTLKAEQLEKERSTKATEKATKAAQEEKGTLALLAAENKKLTQERKTLNLYTAEGKARLEEINKSLDANNKFIKDNSDALTKQRLNVGNYSESIKDALGKLGLFGEAFERFHKIQETVAAFLKIITVGQKEQTEATAANTAATEANTAATESHIAATETNTVASEVNSVASKSATAATEANTIVAQINTDATALNSAATEANTIAIEAEEAATVKLSTARKILNAVTSPTGLIIAGLVAVTKVIYDNLTATQIQKDVLEAQTEGLEKGAKKLDIFGKSALGTRAKIIDLVLAEKALHDEQEANLPLFEKLRAEAEEARTEAEKENVTTQEKIGLITDFIGKSKELAGLQREEKIKELAQTLGLTQKVEVINDQIVATYDLEKAEQILLRTQKEGGKIRKEDFAPNSPRLRANIDAANQAAQAVIAIDTDLNRSLRRATKRQTSLIEEDRKERLALIRESEKRESNLIEEAKARQIADENFRFNNELQDTKARQKKIGAIRIDENGNEIDETKKFNKEIETIIKNHNHNKEEIERKESEKIRSIRGEARIAELKDQVSDAGVLVQQKFKEYQRITEDIIKKGQLFNKKVVDERNIDFDLLISNLLQETDIKEKQLEKQAELDKQAAEDSEKNAKILTEKKFKIEKQLQIDIDNLHRDEKVKEDEFTRQKAEDDIKIEQEKFLKKIDFAKKLTSSIAQQLSLQNQATNDSLQFQTTQTGQEVDRQTQLAAAGRDNNLEDVKSKLAQETLERKDNIRKQQQQQQAIQLAEFILNDVNSKITADPKKSYTQAVIESIGEAAGLKAIAATVAGAFVDGTDHVGKDLKKVTNTGTDDYLIRVHGPEKVFNEADSKKIGYDITNSEVADIVQKYKSGYLPGYMMPVMGSTGSNMANSAMLHLQVEGNGYLKKMVEKPVYTGSKTGKDGVRVDDWWNNGNKTTIRREDLR